MTKNPSSDFEKEKLEIIKWIVSLQDETAIEKIKILKSKSSKSADWWDEISEEEKASIEKGLSDIKSGRVKSQKDALKIYGKWL